MLYTMVTHMLLSTPQYFNMLVLQQQWKADCGILKPVLYNSQENLGNCINCLHCTKRMMELLSAKDAIMKF
jgi:hypothetical protein